MELAVFKPVDILAGTMLCVGMAILKLELKTKRLHENFLQVRTQSCLLRDEEVRCR